MLPLTCHLRVSQRSTEQTVDESSVVDTKSEKPGLYLRLRYLVAMALNKSPNSFEPQFSDPVKWENIIYFYGAVMISSEIKNEIGEAETKFVR